MKRLIYYSLINIINDIKYNQVLDIKPKVTERPL